MTRLAFAVAVLAVLPACQPTSPTSESEPTTIVAAANGPAVLVHCGYERWSVKTGSDPAAGKVNLTAQPTTVAELVGEKSPLPPTKSKYPPQTPRTAQEMQAVSVHATVVRYAAQQDGDLHIVLSDAGRTMIVEIPNPQCVNPSSPFLAAIVRSRAAFLAKTGYVPPVVPKGKYAPLFVKAHIPATVTGVRFFDPVHGQSGVAGNGVELHPVTDIAF